MTTNSGYWKLLRRSTATGLVVLLVLANPLLAAAKIKPDWSKVQAVKPGTQTKVLLYKDQSRGGSLKIEGQFHSATVESVTLTLGHGQTRTLRKQEVLMVLVDRLPYEGLITAGASTALFLSLAPGWDLNGRGWALFGGLFVGAPTVFAFLVSPKVRNIYYVPPDHRAPSSTGTTPPRNRSSAMVSGVKEAAGSRTGSELEDNLLTEQSSADRLRQQARQALIRKGLPLRLPDLSVRSVSAEGAGMRTAFDGSFLRVDGSSRRASLD